MQLLANLGVNASTRKDSFFIETGLIVEWFGTAQTVPEGWALCDGQNGTPNLIDKFVVGAGGIYNIGDTGGSADAILPSHTHSGSTNIHSHSHSISLAAGQQPFIRTAQRDKSETTASSANTPTDANGAHTHTTSVSTLGESATDKNLPPYLSLFYIIKEEN